MQIFFETRPVAELVPGDIGPSLIYDPSWITLRGAFPVSSRMPVRDGIYGPETVLPWIVNLLPEDRNLEAVARITGTGQADALGILAEIGRDTSGALSFAERGTARMEYRVADDETALERIINELPSKPFLAGEDGVSMSLAGVQTKLGVHLDDRGRICVPINGSPSTWILKPDSERLWGGVANEAFCLLLARNSGIAAPMVRIGKAGGRSYLLVARYDRMPEGETWRRLHQEDFCQALGHFPATKYERNGSNRPGPRIRDLIGTTRTLMGVGDVLTLLQQIIFNIIVCNTDAHSKNYSMLVRGDGFSISPIYDVMCAAVWPKVTKYLAMSVATKRDGNHLLGKHWQREAVLCGLGRPALLRAVGQMCDRVEAHLDTTVGDLVAMYPEGRMMAELCRQEIRTRIGHLRAGMKETEADSAPWVARHDIEPPKS